MYKVICQCYNTVLRNQKIIKLICKMLNIIDTLGKALAIYNLLLIVAGIVLNPIVLYICLKSKALRSSSTFKLLAVNSVNDLINCIAWNMECFTDTFFGLHLYSRNFFYCKWISTFLEFTTQTLTSWMLVSISLDRLLTISFKNWSIRYFRGFCPYLYSFFLTLLIAFINFSMAINSGYKYAINGTEIIVCFDNASDEFPFYELMTKVNFFFYSCP